MSSCSSRLGPSDTAASSRYCLCVTLALHEPTCPSSYRTFSVRSLVIDMPDISLRTRALHVAELLPPARVSHACHPVAWLYATSICFRHDLGVMLADSYGVLGNPYGPA